VHEGETGLLYPMGDVNQLAASIRALDREPELAEKMGRKGRQLVRELYTPSAHYQALLGLYERMIATKKIALKKKKTAAGPALVATSQAPPWSRIHPSAIAASRREAVFVASQKPKLRLAFIGGRGVISKYSGIEAYYEEVGARMVQMGHEVTVYCRNYFTPSLTRHNGMRLVRLPTIRSKHWETVVHTILSTAHVLTQKCDVVHYHALGPALFSFLPRLFGKKTVVTVQGLDWQRKKWGWLASQVLRLGERASVQLPSGTMVVSQALRQHYRKEHGIETFYVPNGGVLRERREPKKILEWGLEPGQYILFLGRFSPEKGCHLLVEAYEQLDTNVRLVLAGGSSYCDDYTRGLRTHASERILMLDWISGETLDELLTNAMVFALPSDVEGLSLALLDAMGAGLCVLTSDIPENRELVDEAGFTFQKGNSTDLADRLRFLIANPAIREAAGRAAKARIREQYLWPTIAENIERVYFAVTGGGRPETTAKKPVTRVEAATEAAARAKRIAG
jgi:glycosyltransferase involved in cell wall biosynthesis